MFGLFKKNKKKKTPKIGDQVKGFLNKGLAGQEIPFKGVIVEIGDKDDIFQQYIVRGIHQFYQNEHDFTVHLNDFT